MPKYSSELAWLNVLTVRVGPLGFEGSTGSTTVLYPGLASSPSKFHLAQSRTGPW